jgi:hypothetical protein
MKKSSRMPHEQALPDGDTGVGPEHDGLPAADDQDVEGHGARQFLPGLPGTGGDEIAVDAGDDVEGHSFGHTKGERLSPGMPGTGGD